MKKYYNKFLIATVVSICLFTLSSCKKYLDTPLPTNAVTTASAFGSKGVIDGMMSQMYVSFNSATWDNGNYVRELEGVADNAYNPTTYSQALAYMTANMNTVTGGIYYSWSIPYKSIYMANLMIEGLTGANAPGLTDETKKQYIAAAKTIRAYTYFHMVRMYGDVPLVTSTNVEENKLLGRSPVAEIYALIEKDLKDAIDDLPATPGNHDYINNKFVPEAILANVYLTQGKWALAEAAAADIISSNKYHLAVNVNDVFLQTSPETILGVGWTNKYNENISQYASSTSVWVTLPTGWFASFGEGSFAALSPDLLNSFEPGDLRRTNWVFLSNTGNYPNPINRWFCYKYKYNALSDGGPIPAGREEENQAIRLAEIYLIRAEARAQQNKLTEAAADLNMIRTRASLGNTTAATQTALLDAILKERRVELFYENGTRWYDLVRTGKANTVLSAIPYKTANWKPYMVLFPVPPVDLNANPKLTQNPGY